MPPPLPPAPPNALGGSQHPKIVWRFKRGADRHWAFEVRYEPRAEAPPVARQKVVRAKRARPEDADEEHRMIPKHCTDRIYDVEQAHAECAPPPQPPTKRPRRRIHGPSERYQNSEGEARDLLSASEVKSSSSTEDRPASSATRIPTPRETRNVQPHAGQPSSTATKKKITFTLELTKEEIVADFAAMGLPLPARRPRKVRKSRFEHLFPGSGLPKAVTAGQYAVKGCGNC